MTNSEIFKLGHKIAKEIKIEGNYKINFTIGLKIAYKIAKLTNKVNSSTHITIWNDMSVQLSSSVCSIANNYQTKKGLTQIDSIWANSFIDFSETPAEKFTRQAIEKFNKIN